MHLTCDMRLYAYHRFGRKHTSQVFILNFDVFKPTNRCWMPNLQAEPRNCNVSGRLCWKSGFQSLWGTLTKGILRTCFFLWIVSVGWTLFIWYDVFQELFPCPTPDSVTHAKAAQHFSARDALIWLASARLLGRKLKSSLSQLINDFNVNLSTTPP